MHNNKAKQYIACVLIVMFIVGIVPLSLLEGNEVHAVLGIAEGTENNPIDKREFHQRIGFSENQRPIASFTIEVWRDGKKINEITSPTGHNSHVDVPEFRYAQTGDVLKFIDNSRAAVGTIVERDFQYTGRSGTQPFPDEMTLTEEGILHFYLSVRQSDGRWSSNENHRVKSGPNHRTPLWWYWYFSSVYIDVRDPEEIETDVIADFDSLKRVNEYQDIKFQDKSYATPKEHAEVTYRRISIIGDNGYVSFIENQRTPRIVLKEGTYDIELYVENNFNDTDVKVSTVEVVKQDIGDKDTSQAVAIVDAPATANINETYTVTSERSFASTGAKIRQIHWFINGEYKKEFDNQVEIEQSYGSKGTYEYQISIVDTAGKTANSNRATTEITDTRNALAEAGVTAQEEFYEGVYGWTRNTSRFYYMEEGELKSVGAKRARDEGLGWSYWKFFRDKDNNGIIDDRDTLNDEEYEFERGYRNRRLFSAAEGGSIAFDFVGEVYMEVEADPIGGSSDFAMIQRPVLPTPHAQMKILGYKKENRKVILENTSIYHRKYPAAETRFYIRNLATGEEAVITPNSNSNIAYIKNLNMDTSIENHEKVELLIKEAGEYEITVFTRDTRGHTDIFSEKVTIVEDEPPVAKAQVRSRYFRKPQRTEEDLVDDSYSPDGDIMNTRDWSYQYDKNNTGNFASIPSELIGTRRIEQLRLKDVGNYLGNLKVREDIDFTIPQFLTEDDYLKDTLEWSFMVDNIRPITTASILLSQIIDVPLFSDYNNINFFENNIENLEADLLNDEDSLITPFTSVGGFDTGTNLINKQFDVVRGGYELNMSRWYLEFSQNDGLTAKGNLIAYGTNMYQGGRRYFVRNIQNSTTIYASNNDRMETMVDEDYIYFIDYQPLRVTRINVHTLEEDIFNISHDIQESITDVEIVGVEQDVLYFKVKTQNANSSNQNGWYLLGYNTQTQSLFVEIQNFRPIEVISYNGKTYSINKWEDNRIYYFYIYEINNSGRFNLIFEPERVKILNASGTPGAGNFFAKETHFVVNEEKVQMMITYEHPTSDRNRHYLFFNEFDLDNYTTREINLNGVMGNGVNESIFTNRRPADYSIDFVYKKNNRNIFSLTYYGSSDSYRFKRIIRIPNTGNNAVHLTRNLTNLGAENPMAYMDEALRPANTKFSNSKVYDVQNTDVYEVDYNTSASTTNSRVMYIFDVQTENVVRFNAPGSAKQNPTFGHNANSGRYVGINSRNWNNTHRYELYDLATKTQIFRYDSNGSIQDSILYIFGENAFAFLNDRILIIDLNTNTLANEIYLDERFAMEANVDNNYPYIVMGRNTGGDYNYRMKSFKINEGIYEIIRQLQNRSYQEDSKVYIPIVTKDNLRSIPSKNTELINLVNELNGEILFLGSNNNVSLGEHLAENTGGIFESYSTNANALGKIRDYILNDLADGEPIKSNVIYLNVGEKFQVEAIYNDYEDDPLAETLYKVTENSWNPNNTGWETSYPDHFNTTGVRYLGIKQKDRPSENEKINEAFAKWSTPYVIKIVVGDSTTPTPEPEPVAPYIDLMIISDEGENIGKQNRRVDFILMAAQGTAPIDWSTLDFEFSTDYAPTKEEHSFDKEFSRVFRKTGKHTVTVTLKDEDSNETKQDFNFEIIKDEEPIADFKIIGDGRRDETGFASFDIKNNAYSPDDDTIELQYFIEGIDFQIIDGDIITEKVWYPMEVKNNNFKSAAISSRNKIKQVVTEYYANGIGLNGEILNDYRIFQQGETIEDFQVINEPPTIEYEVAPNLMLVGGTVTHNVAIEDDTPLGNYAKYKIIHDENYFRNHHGKHELHDIVTEEPLIRLDKKGKYEFYAKAYDEDGASSDWEYGGTVIVASKPIADFQLHTKPSLNNEKDLEYMEDHFAAGSMITIKNLAYNEDYGASIPSHGINYYRLEYREQGTLEWILIDEITLNNNNAKPNEFNFNHRIHDIGKYEVKMTVRSPEGFLGSTIKPFTILEPRIDAELIPEEISSGQAYTINATISKDGFGVVAYIPYLDDYVTLEKTGKDEKNQYFSKTLITEETLKDGYYNIEAYGLYPFLADAEQPSKTVVLTVNTPFTIEAYLTPDAPFKWVDVQNRDKGLNSIVTLPSSESIDVEMFVFRPVTNEGVPISVIDIEGVVGEGIVILNYDSFHWVEDTILAEDDIVMAKSKYIARIEIPEWLEDKDSYDLAFNVKIANENTAINKHQINVSTPINLVPAAPSIITPFSNINLVAQTSKYAATVDVEFMDNSNNVITTISLSGSLDSENSNKKNWVSSFKVPELPEGQYKFRFVARTPNNQQEVKIINTELHHLQIISARLLPNPALAGDELIFTIETKGFADRIVIDFPSDIINNDNRNRYNYPLSFSVDGSMDHKTNTLKYISSVDMPKTLSPKNERLRDPYTFTVRVYKEDIKREIDLTLEVRRSVLDLIKPGIRN